MFLPSKSIELDQALIAVAGQILLQLPDRESRSLSSTWAGVQTWRREQKMQSAVPFWWFALAVDTLYAINAIEMQDGVLRRVSHAAAAE
ncbi:ABC-three component system middle component 6 [Kineococcus sp. NBC_00420]|uniref:ABC-three component system middle component 6 n=1 Tax=Kineococcus sp. NBC_00420 TaxID=2903564 RepID=UPI003FA5E541